MFFAVSYKMGFATFGFRKASSAFEIPAGSYNTVVWV